MGEPVHVLSGGFLTQRRLRRILALAGHPVRVGLPRAGGLVAVWGQSRVAWRGEALARGRGAGVLRVEDAWLRSVRPARLGREPPLGLLIDRTGVHFDGRAPSDLETLLRTHPLDDTGLLDRARAGIARLRRSDLSKYNAHDPDLEAPPPGYVLVVDQTRGDASVAASGADRNRFRELLALAREAHPGALIVVKSHPETAGGARAGHLGPGDLGPGMEIVDAPVSPWRLLDGAVAVWTVSSQLGFEAILAGHRPVVLGQPFYAGWGLTEDMMPVARRGRALTRAQLFAGAVLLYPAWYDPHRDRLCPWEDAAAALEALAGAWRDDRRGWVAAGMRLWKRPSLQAAFGRERAVVFAEGARAVSRAAADGRRLMAWAGRAAATPGPVAGLVRVEDGFLRSRGLGAELVPPLSLVLDDRGIYYDPTRASRWERVVAASGRLAPDERARAERLVRRLRDAGLSKYNLAGALPDLPAGRRVLVPGQVEDDASVRLGGGGATNRALLVAAREANPDAVILYKPHPDVEAGLRPGAVPDARGIADAVLAGVGAAEALAAADAVWTITSTMGFEALVRGLPVTCLGWPFYAGWGLTDDRGAAPEGLPARRAARPDLVALVHAALVAYPRYHDPVTGLPCPVEVAMDRLASGRVPRRSAANRALSKVQGLLASRARLWR